MLHDHSLTDLRFRYDRAVNLVWGDSHYTVARIVALIVLTDLGAHHFVVTVVRLVVLRVQVRGRSGC